MAEWDRDLTHTEAQMWLLRVFFLRFYLFIFSLRGREGEREGKKHQCVVAAHVSPPGELAHNPGICLDRESNQQPFGLQASTQSTEPHQPGLKNPSFLKPSNYKHKFRTVVTSGEEMLVNVRVRV